MITYLFLQINENFGSAPLIFIRPYDLTSIMSGLRDTEVNGIRFGIAELPVQWWGWRNTECGQASEACPEYTD